jgi:DNA-binding MarR family transcriptional regulator
MRMIDYLCERDFVKRKQGEEDRRCQFLEVTQKAIDIEPFIRKGIAQTNDLLMNNFTAEEHEIFKRGIDKIYQKITQLPEPDFIINTTKKDGKEII